MTSSKIKKSRGANSQSSSAKFSPNPTAQDRRSFASNLSSEAIHKGAGVGWGRGRGRGNQSNNINIKRTDMVANESDARYGPFFERHIRISETNQSLRPNGGAQFGTYKNGLTNHYQYSNVSSWTMPYGRGRGRLQHGSNNANSGRGSPSNSLRRPQWSEAKVYQVKDQKGS